MFRLIFETPSRICPLHKKNGQEVELMYVYAKRRVQRARRVLPIYFARFADGEFGYVIADELFLEPA